MNPAQWAGLGQGLPEQPRGSDSGLMVDAASSLYTGKMETAAKPALGWAMELHGVDNENKMLAVPQKNDLKHVFQIGSFHRGPTSFDQDRPQYKTRLQNTEGAVGRGSQAVRTVVPTLPDVTPRHCLCLRRWHCAPGRQAGLREEDPAGHPGGQAEGR